MVWRCCPAPSLGGEDTCDILWEGDVGQTSPAAGGHFGKMSGLKESGLFPS